MSTNYQDEAALLLAVMAVARGVVMRLENMLFHHPFAQFSPFSIQARLLVGLRGAALGGASLAISRGMPREEVAQLFETFAQQIRSGEASALAPTTTQALEVELRGQASSNGRGREPPS